MIDTRARHALGASTLVVALASLLLACSGSPNTTSGGGTSPSHDVRTTASAPAAQEPAAGEPAAADATEPAPGVEKVRDVFARLQATYNDGCTTPGNCEYFLGRVLDELNGLDAAMKADPQGPAHFKEPLARIAELRAELGGDRSFENLKQHQQLLTGTRDKINAWMQGHPEDYR
ncbi:hypothetical protein AB0N87_01475 [Streptomyces sp. NPDC093228]|jgi:hypothetical protein|uniref:hypothetical protein n=1 Tax=unclassified Streptomyces TaxID=2593676 RepID=UPI0007412F25|nr:MULTISPECIES: hypothetical protein [unclassified Streptomyces]KUJ37505.1 hypothetical protein ADL25_27805 [Streptomyces sp. NRRL F-5122]MDX3262402.1 hypothetical protein [Streptomyces sp. MI02-2A]REE61546.1 hypothetical protein BX257_4130 [Streptomyces sp. 3212.3]